MSFGGVIKLQGESNYRKAIRSINQSLRVLGSEMKKSASEFTRNDKSVANLTAQNKILNKNVDEQQKKIATLKGALEDAKKEYGEDSAQVKNWQTQLNNAEAQLNNLNHKIEQNKKDIKAANDETAKSKTPYEALTRTIREQEQELDKLKTAYKNATLEGKNEDAETKQLATDIKRLSSELNDNKNKMNAAEKAADRLGNSAKTSGEKAETAAKGGFSVFRGMLANIGSQAVTRAISGIKQLGTQMIDAGMNFEQAMSQVEAISGATGNELEALNAKAREMGSKTKFSATESAEAFNYMAMAGWKTEDMLNGIEGIMSLAAASGEDLANTSDIVTDALTAMGYSAGDAGKLADVMASASSNANTNVKLMGSTFQYAAPIVGALKYSMEDTAIAIGLMANAGIKGDKAGTALRSTLTRLSAPPKACAEEMERLGLALTDGDGKMKSLRTVIDELRSKFKGMSESQQTASAKAIAGANAMSGLLAIVNAAPADYNKLKRAVDNSTGAAAKMSKTMQKNVAGTMTKLKSLIEGVQIQLFKKLAPAFQAALKDASKFVKGINWNSFGNTVKGAFNKALDGLKWIIKNKDLVINGVKLMIAAFAVNKIWQFTKSITEMGRGFINVAKQIAVATAAKVADTTAEGANTVAKTASTLATHPLIAAQTALNTVMAANPVGAVVVALGALVAIIGVVVSATGQMTEAEKKEQEQLDKTEERIKATRDEWKELEKARQKNIDKGNTELSYYQTLWDELKKITDENGKVKEGYEERASFITSTLSDALGIEIGLTDNVVKNYKRISSKIDEIIEKKKAKIILESQEAEYKKAIENEATAIQNLTQSENEYNKELKKRTGIKERIKELTKLYEDAGVGTPLADAYADEVLKLNNELIEEKKTLNKRKSQYQSDLNQYRSYLHVKIQYQNNLAKYQAGKYDEMTTSDWNYYKKYKNTSDAEKKVLEEKIKTTSYKLKKLRKIKKDENTKMYDDEIKAAEKERDSYQTQLSKYFKSSEANLDGAKVVWNRALEKQLSTITGKKVQFKKAANGNVQMMIDGTKVGESKSTKEMANLVTKMIKQISGKKKAAKIAGKNLINGLNDGITDGETLGKAYKNIENFGENLLKRLKKSLKEKSPSKATEEMGVFLIRGISVGVRKEQKQANKLVSDFSKKLLEKIAAHPEKAETYGSKYVTRFNDGIKKAVDSQKTRVKSLIDNYFGKDAVSAFNEAIDSATNSATKQLTKCVTSLTKAMQRKITEVNNKIADMQSKLSSYGTLFTIEKSDVNEQEIVRLTDLDAQIKDLEYYEYLINSLKKKASKGVMNEIASMSIEDGLTYARLLSSLSDERLKKYNEMYDKKQRLAKSISKNFYADDLKEIKENYTDKINAEFKSAQKKIAKMGKQAMQGFVNGMKSKTFLKDIQKIAKDIVKEMKKSLGINSPSRVFRDEIGKNVALGLGGGFTDTMAKISSKMVAAVPTEFDGKYNLDTTKGAQRQNISNITCNVTVNAGSINNDLDAKHIGEQVCDGFVKEINRLRGAFVW